MTWASSRRFLIIFILAATALVAFGFFTFRATYRAPSCVDGVQNQTETGIDCGGSCPYLCTDDEQAPIIPLVRALEQVPGRIDIAAYIDNPNSAAALQVPFQVTLYAADHTVLKRGLVQVDLPPRSRVPVYLPSFYEGSATGAQAFLIADPTLIHWFTLMRLPAIPQAGPPSLVGAQGAPRIASSLGNVLAAPILNTRVVVFVYDTAHTLIAASQTIVPEVPAQGNAVATFTWNSAFPSFPGSIEVAPVISLTP